MKELGTTGAKKNRLAYIAGPILEGRQIAEEKVAELWLVLALQEGAGDGRTPYVKVTSLGIFGRMSKLGLGLPTSTESWSLLQSVIE